MNPEAALAARIDSARLLARQDRPDLAEGFYAQVLEQTPHQLEALDFVVMRALARGHSARAIALLLGATRSNPESGEIFRGLAVAYMQIGELAGAVDALTSATRLERNDYVARMLLGSVLDRMGNRYGALTNYFGAIVRAQIAGVWTNEETTEPGQREQLAHALRYVVEGRAELFYSVIKPFLSTYGPQSMRRVEHALAVYLKEVAENYADPRQKPIFFYFPDLPTRPYLARELFPWIAELENRTASIISELRTVLSAGNRLEPFHGDIPPEKLRQQLRSDRGAPAWDSYFFYRHGQRHDSNCRDCPNTVAALDATPLVRIRDHAPEALFSILSPGTHILPHRGVTNTRLVAHLPLIVPDQCALVVGGESHVWQEGRVVIFDDTFEHEAWNRSECTRAVLILDIWNPYLDEAERDAMTHLVPAIGDFNRDCGL